MSKFCEYCGAPLKEGVRFCTSCGHSVTQSAQPSEQTTYNQNQYNGGSYTQQQPSHTQQPPYAQQPPQQAYAYGGQPPYQQPQKKKGGCCLIALIVLLVILAALGIGGYFAYKYAKDNFNEVKDKIEESLGMPLSSIIDFDDPEQLEKLEELGVTSEDIGKIKEMVDQNDKPKKSKGSNKSSKIKVKDEEFFGVAFPFPDMGEITSNFTDWTSSGEVNAFYIDKISYQQFIEYCKLLEALPGWEPDARDNVARFPKDYNEKMMTQCVGNYNGQLHVVVTYLSDSFIKGTDMSHFGFKVNKK